MYKRSTKHICQYCGKEFTTLYPKKRCCSNLCAKKLWSKEIKNLGHNKTKGAGQKKGNIPWNKGKKCPSLSKSNNGFYNKKHTLKTKVKIKQGVYHTKKKHNSFHISQEEQQIKELLLEKFLDLRTQYVSKEYPFACDFYIPSKDLYIEYQGHWTHGIYNHIIYGPFDSTNIKHIELLNIWKNKNTKYFDNAIKTWTQLDPLKQEYINKNNLNFLKFYTIDEFKEWFKKLD